jgi:glutamyl/glutaminyl-tRNA synthetase
VIFKFFVTRLNEWFEKDSRRYKLQEGILEKDLQNECLILTRFNELKTWWINNTYIQSEMFDSLMENTKSICSNENLWKTLNDNKAILICEY